MKKLSGIELYRYKFNQKLKAEDNMDRRKGKIVTTGLWKKRLQNFI
jgi:hypothetical protein